MSGDHNADQKDSSFLDKPEALRLADIMDTECGGPISLTIELRRLHEVNQEFLEIADILLEEDNYWAIHWRADITDVSNALNRLKLVVAKARGETE